MVVSRCSKNSKNDFKNTCNGENVIFDIPQLVINCSFIALSLDTLDRKSLEDNDRYYRSAVA